MSDFDPAAVALVCARQAVEELRDADRQLIEDGAGERLTGSQAAAVRKHLESWVIRLESVLPPREDL
jgi:hypothetical protein